MRISRSAAILLAVGVAVVTLAGELVTNTASAAASWPGWLLPLHNHPWPALGVLTTLIVLATVALTIFSEATPGHSAGDPPDAALVAEGAMVLRTLPRDAATFTNRTTEVERLISVVDAVGENSIVPIIAIDGMPGMGKTAFAVHAGHLLAPRFPDGQIFINLNGYTAGMRPVDPADALAALLAADGVTTSRIPTGPDPDAVRQARAAMWRSRVTSKRMLLIFDNASSFTQVESLLPGEGSCLVLVTSRRRLAVTEGISLAMEPLDPVHAIALFSRLAGRDAMERADVAAVVELCGFLPLAISLLAAQLRHRPARSPAHLLTRLRAARNRVGELHAGDRAVLAAFDLSFQALTNPARAVFRLLGFLPGADIDAFAVAALAESTAVDAGRVLDSLYDNHFLDENGPSRYRLHDLLRDYARALIADSDSQEHSLAVDRLRDYYLHALTRANVLIGRNVVVRDPATGEETRMPILRTRTDALAWLTDERANVLALIKEANARGQFASVVSLTAAIAPFLRHAGPWDQAAQVHRTAAIAAARINDESGQAGAQANLGIVLRLMGAYHDAVSELARALRIYRGLEDLSGAARTLNQIGIAWYLVSEYTLSEVAQVEALELCTRIGERAGEANALADLGMVRRQTGDYAGAAEAQARALAIYQETRDIYGQANSLRDLGILRSIGGEYAVALDHHAAALLLYQRLDDRLHQAYALNELGCVQRIIGAYAESLDAHSVALGLYREFGDRFGEANSLRHLGTLHSRTGRTQTARQMLGEARQIYTELDSRAGDAAARSELAVLDNDASAMEIGMEFAAGITVLRELNDRYGVAEVTNHWGFELLKRNDHDGALEHFRAAVKLAEEIGCPLEIARAQAGLGRCLSNQGQLTDGQAYLDDAQGMFRRMGIRDLWTK